MTITKGNLHQAIAALRQCAKENENGRTDTGAIRVSDLCSDVADYLEGLPADDNPALTWEDMMRIHRHIKDTMNFHLYELQNGVEGQQKVYQNVLDRFLKEKNEDRCREEELIMRTFKARITETNGQVVTPEYMADEDFWRWHEPKQFLIGFWGLLNADVVSYEIFEIVDGKEVAI
jgi:hypothetical protein